MGILSWLIVGAIAGWIASKVVPGDEGYGPIGGLIAGIVGALVGGWLFATLTAKDDWLTGTQIGLINISDNGGNRRVLPVISVR